MRIAHDLSISRVRKAGKSLAVRSAARFTRGRSGRTRLGPDRRHESERGHSLSLSADLWPQLFSDVSCIALWISREKILTRLYSLLHWFHKRLEANVKNPRENRCFQNIIVCSVGSVDNSNKCAVLWKIAVRLITVSASVNNEMWVKLSRKGGRGDGGLRRREEAKAAR